MVTVSSTYLDTDLARLYVEKRGNGRPIVLWHSLFVDSRSWGRLVDELALHGTVFTVDGPSHGRSDPVRHRFDFTRCVDVAIQALDGLGLSGPVDWVGNAWGGHVGLMLAAAHPQRLRTLTTIAAPVQPIPRRELLTKDWPLVLLYRLLGPNRLIVGPLFSALLGSQAMDAEPEATATVVGSFASADRRGMALAITSLMLHRTSIEQLLPRVAVPTLVLSARDDVTGWRPEEARRTSAAIPHCQVHEVAGTGHVAPLLVDTDRIRELLLEFWART